MPMTRRRVLAGVVLLGLMSGGVETAQADTRFTGKSGQGRTVHLRTGDDGLVLRFSISWRADCRRPGYVFDSGTQTTPASPFEVSTPDRFVDVGGYRERLPGRTLAVYRARTVGKRVSERRWKGIFRIRVRAYRRDRLIDRCYLRTRWRVRRLPA
jgi:hypothetical protein